MRSNEDVPMYRVARRILAGELEWMEEGIVGLQEIGVPGPDEPECPFPQATEEPAGVSGS
jgi:hypothetical protein